MTDEKAPGNQDAITKDDVDVLTTSNDCGIVMPISAIDGCSESHWSEVRKILSDSIRDVGLVPALVSDGSDVGLIHARIVNNLYNNPIVVCDVSGKNPNVMFELGMRLAFDKPTLIVKDDQTSYSFDTSSIEHLTYPRDLRFSKIVDFKVELGKKLIATLKKAQSGESYTTFLGHFGSFKVAHLKTESISRDDYLLSQSQETNALLSKLITRLDLENEVSYRFRGYQDKTFFRKNLAKTIEAELLEVLGDRISIDIVDDDELRLFAGKMTRKFAPEFTFAEMFDLVIDLVKKIQKAT